MSSNLKVAFVLAAGRGERLRPYTDTTPKPLMPIAGKPILYHTLKSLECLNLERVVLNAWHLKEQIVDFVDRHRAEFSFSLEVSCEDELLGTGGGLKKALPLMGLHSETEPFLMMNADVIFVGDLKGFCQRALRSNADGSWWLAKEQPAQTRISVEGNSIVKIGKLWAAEKTSVGLVPQIQGCFSGIQVFRRLRQERLPNKGCIIRDYWISLLQEAATLGGDFHGLQFWADIGTPESYMALKDSLPQI